MRMATSVAVELGPASSNLSNSTFTGPDILTSTDTDMLLLIGSDFSDFSAVSSPVPAPAPVPVLASVPVLVPVPASIPVPVPAAIPVPDIDTVSVPNLVSVLVLTSPCSVSQSSGSDSSNYIISPPPQAMSSTFSATAVGGHTPFSLGHLEWHCWINGPLVPEPVIVTTLIDNGLHSVLIDDGLVTRLGLRRRHLPSPQQAQLVMGNEEVVFIEWVKLKTVSADNQWTAQVVWAIVAPNLTYPVILGGPWLQSNKIVIDSEFGKVVAKETHTGGKGIYNQWIHCDLIVIF